MRKVKKQQMKKSLPPIKTFNHAELADCFNRGNTLLEQRKFNEARVSYLKALTLKPDFAEAHNNLGVVLQQLGDFNSAIECHQRALLIKPNYAQAHLNLGLAFNDLGEFNQAVEQYQQVLLLKPNYADAYCNLGITLKNQGKYNEAIESYQRAISLNPNFGKAYLNQGILLLSLGRFEEGWQYYEGRCNPSLKNRHTVIPNFQFPQWQGESIKGKSLVVWCEQGFGDEIQFCRYAQVLKDQKPRQITWICRKPLKALFKTLKAVDNLIIDEEIATLTPHDYWTFLLSIPLHCHTTLKNIPASIPYLEVNPKQVKNIATELKSITEFKVGICWQGSKTHTNDRNRSPGIAPFKKLFNLPNVKFFTLQPNTCSEFINAAGKNGVDRGREIDSSDFEDVAALIENLDLIISCDTSICHLAGALGKPVWIVLPFAADWRWMMDREDSPWYPTVRLFRQSVRGDWNEVFNRVESSLKEVLIKNNPQISHLNDKATELYNQGKLFRKQGNLAAAIESYQQALLLKSDYAQAYYEIANIFLGQEKLEFAIENYRHAVLIKPDFAEAYNNMGVALQQLGKLDEAIKCHQYALKLKPNYAQAFQNLGIAFDAQGKLSISLENYQRALLLNPDNADIHINLGHLFDKQDKLDEAIDKFQDAINLNPNLIEAHILLGRAFEKQGKLNEAIKSYQSALSLNSDSARALDGLLYTQTQCYDWTQYSLNVEKIIKVVAKGGKEYRPFAFLRLSDSAAIQLQCASTYTALKYPLSQTPLWKGECYQHNKIRIAYISADFREHPISFLMAGLFEQHDTKRFEITAFSLQPAENSTIGQRVKAAFDQFIDVTHSSDYEVALLIRQLEIDIVVDLMGFTKKCRPGIFTYRPAPVQVNYLGYPATMGANYIDYIFADAYLIPAEYQEFYTEKVVYLPDCFQANDDKRVIDSQKPTRTEVGLPESGFVFCSFNNSYKINPVFFDMWMRLLHAVPNSVLWLVADNLIVPNNLRNEAIKHGVNPERLVFANRLFYAGHLARLQLADLFLDTLPFNAGTTASDTLWAGVPIITCSGEAFAARMAGSLLNAIGLPELITHNLEQYEALAFKLATTPELLAEIRAKLAENRNTSPLFDTNRFCRHIESAYITMWERYQRGESPVSFAVQPQLENTQKQEVDDIMNLKSMDADAYYQAGNVCLSQGNLNLAIENYRQAVSIKPDFADAYCNLGVALKEQGELESAIESYCRAIAITPDDAEIYSNLGEALWKQRRFDEAIENYHHALALNSNVADIYNNLGIVFKEQGKLDKAIENYRYALKINPNDAKIHCDLATSLKEQKQTDLAIQHYQTALNLDPDYVSALDGLFHLQLDQCNWSDYRQLRDKSIRLIQAGERDYQPFSFLALSDSVALQQICAGSYPAFAEQPLWTGLRYQHDKIRIAYISGDFREHAVSLLIAGLIEQHNQQQFEIIAISLLPEEKSPMGQRIKNAFSQFIDVSGRSDHEVALLMRELEIDIAVDLVGFTGHCRPWIFTYRSAPIQVNYLGYPATMGANYIDYIFADAYLIPAEYQEFYTEKVVYLPDCFQANDDKRVIDSQKPTRTEVGLPESGFVFCSFNNSYKITPFFFDVWMRLLKSVPNSVLWLVADNLGVENNLRSEATHRGVSSERLIFAKRLPYADHLARFQLADLFLDTLPFNAGTTASDSLWAGVPVITCSGEAFAARMAGSLLHAIGLPELITENLEDYETLAIKLATHPYLLVEIRTKLAKNRNTYPLFNTERFCRHIESAYITMWEKSQRGELSTSFAVQPIEQQHD